MLRWSNGAGVWAILLLVLSPGLAAGQEAEAGPDAGGRAPALAFADGDAAFDLVQEWVR